MAGLMSNVLFLTMQFMILDCTERTVKLVYTPYGPKMCRQLCEDLGAAFYYIPEFLLCQHVPRQDYMGSIKQPLKHCLLQMEDITRNHAPALPLTTALDACDKRNEDVHQSNLQRLTTTEATHGGGQQLGHISHNISLHQACEEGSLCTVQFILSQRLDDINARDKLGRTPVMAAVLKDQVTVFDFLVNQSCDIMAVDNSNDSVLHIACDVGSVDIVRKLVVNHTCDIDSTGGKGMTPVMRSALHGHRDVFDLLLSKSCNATIFDDNMNNILHVACSGGHVDMVNYVLRKLNFGIECRGEMGRTPVMIAAHRGHVGVADLLASSGSDLFVRDDNKDNILHVACTGGHVDMVQHILNKRSIDIESKGKYGRTPVMRAAEYGQMSVVKFLVDKGCNVTALDDNTDNVLHVACVGGHVDMVKCILLKGNITIDSQGQCGQTPVMTAVRYGHIDVVTYLVGMGCNLSVSMNNGNTILHMACIYGHVHIVKYILSQTNISIDSRGYNGRTPVMYAATFGHMSVFMFLLNQGCKLTMQDKDKNNILHGACMGGHDDIVKQIVEKQNISIDSTGQYGWTSVMAAASCGHMSLVKYLVNRGCKLSIVDAHGNNIIHLACMGGNVKLLKYILLQTNFGIESKGQNGQTPVMTAARFGHEAVVKYLVSKQCKMSIVSIHGNSILHFACMSGNVKLLKCILSQTKLGVESTGIYGRTPAMVAASYGHMSLVKYLVHKGCKLSIVDDHGNNIIHLACMGGNVELLKFIISQTKPGIESRGQYGRTPVMTAASYGHMTLVKYLISKRCKLSRVDNVGNNILHLACMAGNVEFLNYILSHTNFGLDCRSQNGQTPVMTAAYFGHEAVVKYFVGKECKMSILTVRGNSILHLACISGNVELVKYILSQTKPGIENTGDYGRTPVMVASTYGHMSLVKYFISKGCNLSSVDTQGNTILHLACMGGNVELVEYIISQTNLGIDVKGQNGRTPVMHAAYFGYMSLVKYIVGKGCKLTIVDERGLNALDVACARRHEDVVKYLITIKSWSKTC